ncbi:MAG: F0F1 ATP synthase subunit B [Eubacterium sp.]|nr:F0F1 ATP synthase subunit B [Eubacterium sp.]MBQ7200337.1 F0F1 ATP synthase subunit B [Eubacterium sp.]MBR0119466.1 F0F1 ATP synthase subunit B [Eubacterium sp.]
MLILFILLSYLLFNPARKLIEKRKAYIKEQLDEAAEAKESALSMKEEYDNKLAKVDEQSEEMMAEARKKAKARETEIISDADAEAHRIITRAEKEASLEKDKVRDEIKQEIVQVATQMAGKFVESGMDQATQDKLVDETLKEMGDATWQS